MAFKEQRQHQMEPSLLPWAHPMRSPERLKKFEARRYRPSLDPESEDAGDGAFISSEGRDTAGMEGQGVLSLSVSIR